MFQYLRQRDDSVRLLTDVLIEVVGRWDELGAYLGTHRAPVVCEARSHATMDAQIFDDHMVRPRFAIAKHMFELCKCIYI